ncbi:MAG: DMT family transporter [Pseudomonas sp.]
MTPSPTRGAVLLVAAMGAFSLSDVLAKQLAPSLAPAQVAWVRYALLLVTVLPWARRPAAWRTRHPLLHGGRVAGLIGSAVLFQHAIHAMPVAEATAMVFASPLFVTMLAALALREPVSGRRWLAVLLGFAGVLVVVRPGRLAFGGAEVFPLLSSMAWACAVICTRRLASESVQTAMLYPALAGALLLAPWLPAADALASPPQALTALAMAASWCAAQWLTVLAYRTASASSIAPFAYSQLLWAGLLGAAIFGHVPHGMALAGMALILLSGVLAARAAL